MPGTKVAPPAESKPIATDGVEPEEPSEPADTEPGTEVEVTEVEIEDAHGTVSVPLRPETVVSLDSRSFEVLEHWGSSHGSTIAYLSEKYKKNI